MLPRMPRSTSQATARAHLIQQPWVSGRRPGRVPCLWGTVRVGYDAEGGALVLPGRTDAAESCDEEGLAGGYRPWRSQLPRSHESDRAV